MESESFFGTIERPLFFPEKLQHSCKNFGQLLMDIKNCLFHAHKCRLIDSTHVNYTVKM